MIQISANSYILETHADGRVAIVCKMCEFRSFNTYDCAERYCPVCHMFHDAVETARTLAKNPASVHECHDWKTARGVCAVCGRGLA